MPIRSSSFYFPLNRHFISIRGIANTMPIALIGSSQEVLFSKMFTMDQALNRKVNLIKYQNKGTVSFAGGAD